VSTRQHNRGPHPADATLFCRDQWPVLKQSVEHLCWLLSRGYAPTSSLKLVGDRFSLVARQRTAVLRSSCADATRRQRQGKAIGSEQLAHRELEVDALNLLITLESALAGGVVLHARDGAYRDMASIHGSYRRVDQTATAIQLAGEFFQRCCVDSVLWRIDRPVSNSGRLRAMLEQRAAHSGWNWETTLDDDPDRVLGSQYELVATADAPVLDRVEQWANAARWIIDEYVPDAWIVPLALEP
jgi:hypothetical protein